MKPDMTDDQKVSVIEAELAARASELSGIALKYAYAKIGQARAKFVAESLLEGTGQVAINMYPQDPMRIDLLYLTDQGGKETLLTIRADRVARH